MSAVSVADVDLLAPVPVPPLHDDAAAARASRHTVVVPLVRPVAHRVVVVTERELASVGQLGVPCAARPSTGFRHYDGPCQCFFGGPAPVFPPAVNPLPA